MILDALLRFTAAGGDNLASPGTVGTSVSTNAIDWHIAAPPGVPVLAAGQGARDMGIGDDPALKMLVMVGTAFTGAGATLQIALQGAPDNGSGAPGTYVTWWTSPVYALGTLTAGARLYDMDYPRPPAGVVVPRFVQLLYTIGGATVTAGTINAYIVLDRYDQMYNATQNNITGGYLPGVVVPN